MAFPKKQAKRPGKAEKRNSSDSENSQRKQKCVGKPKKEEKEKKMEIRKLNNGIHIILGNEFDVEKIPSGENVIINLRKTSKVPHSLGKFLRERFEKGTPVVIMNASPSHKAVIMEFFKGGENIFIKP